MTSLLLIAITLPLVLISTKMILMLEADNEDVGHNDWDFETQASK
jgi:hypothetical protein|tara:strand:- start:2298 stop:2432 length:135 start_codon:yes stop_codon:yes gene_type:complete